MARFYWDTDVNLENQTEKYVGMVLSCEAGMYIPGFGFRHSDTMIVTEQGPELVTKFPRELESLTVRV